MSTSDLQSAARTGISWISGLLPRSANPPVVLRKSRRAVRRIKLNFTAQLCSGNDQFRVTGLDLHDGGARVLADRPVDVDTLVFMHFESPGLVGFANVRHCSPGERSKYIIGLQFRGSLMQEEAGTWRFEHAVNTEVGPDGTESSAYSMTPSLERDELLREVLATLESGTAYTQ